MQAWPLHGVCACRHGPCMKYVQARCKQLMYKMAGAVNQIGTDDFYINSHFTDCAMAEVLITGRQSVATCMQRGEYYSYYFKLMHVSSSWGAGVTVAEVKTY